ncbi:LOW QUALITY PROTEIN: interleukin-1 receptor type 1-like [Mugil cephalus]|uniref:LOW QUALITY PROTEIN: interleukin-1 receptor type 1-like n=1 Tax=Mugil cephalus TaxID=48193 RepID=UPI001FB786D5|nr:LOW QUALITY PROTEIN: interleukin-1 receptor type 1-like [Mugil cephalus]
MATAAAATGWLCFLTLHLTCAMVPAQNHYGETEIYHVSAGHFFLLRCHKAHSHSRVAWMRGDNSSLPVGTEVRDGSLWFLPVQASQTGTYTCEKRDEAGSLRMTFEVLVSTGECPDAPEAVDVTKGTSRALPCKQTEILKLNSSRNIRWMKDCLPVEQRRRSVSVDRKGDLRLTAPSEKDAGIYTCLIDFSLDGRNYTSARSIQLDIRDETNIDVIVEPEVVFPRESVVMVEVGMSAELMCLAYTGFNEDNETLMYWTVNETYTEDYEELSESWKYIRQRGVVYGHSTLSISKVRTEFLNVSICCHIMTLTGAKFGEAWLQEADHSLFYTSVAVCLAFPLAILCLATSFFLFRVDLILVYRKLLRHFPKQVPDGKLYDAYVSFLHPDMSDETESFVLQILPEELEGQHGYSLYIRGRDDCPGEAIHDVIAATLRQCRRLIIILPSDGKTLETLPLCDNQNQMCYEQKIGLYDALTWNDLQVILVEMDGPVDYSRLPESLRYIKRKQGALKWKKAYTGSHRLTKFHSNKTFWKNLRYHMPAVPIRRRQAVI